ncbi:MAG TPA: OsmC family protein [Gammaproteobacteria bacterium]|nr:OsmC family protein [Gammaproteobacteria bacterium]
MSEHKATIEWQLNDGGDFLKSRFSREHTWTFDGGLSVPASATPAVVPPPLSNPAGVDPEEAFVASLASCHMLTFLFLASRSGFAVQSYRDDAVGTLSKGEGGRQWISTVVLKPRVNFSGDRMPTPEEQDKLHHDAHEQCFIANSVKTQVTVQASA